MTLQTPVPHIKRNTIAGVIRNILEWYDVAVLRWGLVVIENSGATESKNRRARGAAPSGD